MNSQLQAVLQQVIQAFQGRNFDGADLILRKVLQNDVNSADDVFNLGIAYAEANRLIEASAIFGCLQLYKNDDVRIPYNLGLIYSLQGKHHLALAAYDLALKIKPDDIETLINKGLTCNDIKNYTLALEVLESAIQIRPNIPEAWCNKGIALCNLNLYQQSIGAYNEAIKLVPSYSEAWSNKSVPLNKLKRFIESLEACDNAISLKPDYAESWYNKGNTLRELMRFDEAIAHYDKALSLKPDYYDAWNNRGVTLHDLKRFDEAIAHYDKALSLKPDYYDAWNNRGVTLHDLKRFDEAIAHYDKALSLKPDYYDAWNNRGVTLDDLKRFDEAIAHYDKALILKADIDWTYGNLVHAKMRIGNWSGLEESLEKICKKVEAKEKIVNPFILLALNDDASLHKQCSEIYAQNKYPSNITLCSIPKLSKKEKIRIAYFSPDFRNHAVSLLTSELFKIHNKDKFEIFAFSLQKAPDTDLIYQSLRQSFDEFINVEYLSDNQVAQLARENEIDIAIDLAGHTQYSRTGIFALRAAPIQVNWLGYPGTIGADFIDYIVADQTIIPDSHYKFYTEKVVRLPNTYMVDDSKRIASSRIFTRAECGLPEQGFVFCCFNNDYKFNPQVLDGWSRILSAAKNSVLWISENNERFSTNIKIEFEKRGIVSSRIIFAPRLDLNADHLARYALADLFLDTFSYNAHTTAVDSLKSGVPVLTRTGQSFASRVAASLLNAIRLPELITNTQKEYEALAIELAMNPEKLTDIKLKLDNNRLTTPLFDTPLFAKHLETAYIKMMERYQTDLEPDHIVIS